MVKSKLTERARLWLRVGEMASLGAACVILLVFIASSLDGLLLREGQGAAVVTSILADLANTDRASNHIGELTVNPTLSAIAQSKADDMASKGYFAHTTPDGHDPWYWFQKGGYIFTYAGENLAVDFSDSAEVEKAWMESPTHRANILNGHFTEIGIATAVGMYEGHQTTFVVQEFGTPAHGPVVGTQEPVRATISPTKPTEIALATTETVPSTFTAKATTSGATVGASSTPSTGSSQGVLGTSAEGLASPSVAPQDHLGLMALWNVFAASPRTTLKYAYYLFGLIILLALVVETGIEVRRHHIRHVVLVGFLLVLMAGLFITADHFVFTDPVVVDATGVSGTQ